MQKLANSGLRRYSSKEALTLALPLQRLLGISRLASVGEFIDLPGISVVNAVRTTLKEGQVSSTQGKGRSLVSATCSALMEAYERHCACWCDDAIYQRTADQEDSALLAQLGFKPDGEITFWMNGQELHTGKAVRIPAIEVQFPYHKPDAKLTNVRAHTSGLATGGSKEEAICFAMMETIERNITSHFYQHCLSSICADMVDLNSIVHPSTRALWHSLNDKGYESFALRIHGPLPVFYVALYDPVSMGPKFMIAGSASGFTESEALDAALLEAVQGLVVSLQASREDLSRQKHKYASQTFSNQSRFSTLRDLFRRHYPSFSLPLQETSPATLQCATQHLVSMLTAQGKERIYIVDLSLRDTPFHTVKAIVPGMFDRHVNPERDA
ncbi:TPA: YcaO-like family protein [Serratia marcescens]